MRELHEELIHSSDSYEQWLSEIE